MATYKDKVGFVTRFRDAYPEQSREACVHAAGKLLRLARRYQCLAEEACNGPACMNHINTIPYPLAGEMLDKWEAGLKRRQARCEKAIHALCSEWKLPVSLGGDPRGLVVHVRLRGCLDEDGIGVPA